MSQDTTKFSTTKPSGACALSESAANGLSYIEQFSAPQFCETPNRPYMQGTNHTTKEAVFFRPRCKSWACPYCGNINKNLWVAQAYHGAEVLADTGDSTQSNLITFLTITSNARLDAVGSARVFSKAWNNLLRRARHGGSQGQYLLVPERHKDGRVHAHAVATFNLGTRWWKDNCAEVGLGYMAEEEIARTPGGAAFYVSKYLGKALAVTDWPRYWRRIRASRRWPKLPPIEKDEEWRFATLPKDAALDETASGLANGGYEVMFLDHVKAWQFVNCGEIKKSL